MPGEDTGDQIGQVVSRLESSESRERYSQIGQYRPNKKGILVQGEDTGDLIGRWNESRERCSQIGQDRTNKKGTLVLGKEKGDLKGQVAWTLEFSKSRDRKTESYRTR